MRVRSRQIIGFVLAVCGLCAGFSAVALDESRLWLPKSYRSHYVSLVNAALAAEQIERCVTVLEGTVDLDQSTPERPIFRILCRQPSGVSYNEMVDGADYQTLTTPASGDSYWSEESRRQRERQQRLEAFWALCESEIKRATQLMDNLQWVSSWPPEPSRYSEEEAQYRVDFDAETPEGRPLHYRLSCTASQSQASVSILPRSN